MKRTILFSMVLFLAAVTALPQKRTWKSVLGAGAGVSIPYKEFSYNTFRYDAGFASPGPNLEAEYLFYGKIFGFSTAIGYSSLFFDENAYRAEYDRTLGGYGINEVSAGNYQVLKILAGFTLKLPEIEHTEVMFLFHLGFAHTVHPDLLVTNSELGVINSIEKVSGAGPAANAGIKINYWLNERYGISLNGSVSTTTPSFTDYTAPDSYFGLPVYCAAVNVGFVMNLRTPSL
jgi:hypothetical protein